MMNKRMMKTALALSVALVAGSTALHALGAEVQALPAISELAQERAIGKPEVVATFSGAMPTGVTVTETGRIFVNFPRWGDDVPFTVAEVKDNQLVPYPDAAINVADNSAPRKHLLSVQSVVADGRGRVWILDTAAPGFSKPVAGGPKLVAVNLKTNQVEKSSFSRLTSLSLPPTSTICALIFASVKPAWRT